MASLTDAMMDYVTVTSSPPLSLVQTNSTEDRIADCRRTLAMCCLLLPLPILELMHKSIQDWHYVVMTTARKI